MMNEPTKYELVATAPDGRKFLAGYVRIPSKTAMIRMIRQNGQAWQTLPALHSSQSKGKAAWDGQCALERGGFNSPSALSWKPHCHRCLFSKKPDPRFQGIVQDAVPCYLGSIQDAKGANNGNQIHLWEACF